MATLAVLSTPWYRRLAPRPGGSVEVSGSTAATRILDLGAPALRALVDRSRVEAASPEPRDVLAAAHAVIRAEVRPVYAMDESRPASRTLARGTGSCSQRLAILEAVARSVGVPTRSRALLVDRAFWSPRFPRLGAVLPPTVLLAWPEFHLDGAWRGASELFGPIGCRGGGGFANRGAETLFEAAGRCAVDWDGSAGGEFDLSRFVVADLGRFPDRDTVFARFGQTLCAPTRLLLDPVLSRVAA